MTIKERCIALREAFPDASDSKLARIVGCSPHTLGFHTRPDRRVKQYERSRISHKKIVTESKQKLIKFLGGKCSKCGFCGCAAAIDFHHIDSTRKHTDISRLLKGSFDKALEEARHCILLCSNCHREFHDNEGSLGPNNLSEKHSSFPDTLGVGVAGVGVPSTPA